MDLGARLYGVQLDLLDGLFWAFGGAFFDKLGGTRADSVVGRVDVVVEGFLRVVAWGCDAGVLLADDAKRRGEEAGNYRLKKRSAPPLPRVRQYWVRRPWWTHCLAYVALPSIEAVNASIRRPSVSRSSRICGCWEMKRRDS